MRKVLASAALVALVAAGGCMDFPVRDNAPLPDTGNMAPVACAGGSHCSIDVAVVCTVFGCTADAGDVEVTGAAAAEQPATLTWRVPRTAPFDKVFFARNGITFADARFNCAMAAGGKAFSCVDRAPQGKYKYTVRLEWHDNVLVIAPKDPWVVNR
jgi:hypothetical protein